MLAFTLWMLVSRMLQASRPMPQALAEMGPIARFSWLATRVVASVVTVPIAEELAFRGYLMRRLVATDFDRVRFRAAGLTAVVASSAAFAIVHGTLWVAALGVGAIYATVAIRTERIGEAVAAHATTNLLVAAWVLAFGAWQLW
jgi:CAAX prenyl protease-like protein